MAPSWYHLQAKQTEKKSLWCTQDKTTIQHLFGCPRLCFNATGHVRGENTAGPRLTDKPLSIDCNYCTAAVGLTRWIVKLAQNLSFKCIPRKDMSSDSGGLPCAQHKGWNHSIRRPRRRNPLHSTILKYVEIKSLFSRASTRPRERRHSQLQVSILRLTQIRRKQFRPCINRKMARMGKACLPLEHLITRIYFWSPKIWNPGSDIVNCLSSPFQST